MSQQYFTSASLPALKLLGFTGELCLSLFCAFYFQQQSKSLASNRMRNMKGAFVCVKCTVFCICVCGFVCVLQCSMYCVCVYVCIWVKHWTEDKGGQRRWHTNLCSHIWSTKNCIFVHHDYVCVPQVSYLSFVWWWEKAIFSFVCKCFEFDQSHKSIQSQLCMLTL